MKTLLILSVVLVAMTLPIAMARGADPRRAARRLALLLLAFNALYLFYMTRVHTVVFVPHW
jgi:hypothetical protein